MGLLTQAQKDRFWHDGVLVVEDAVSAGQLAAARSASVLTQVDDESDEGDVRKVYEFS